MTARSSRDIMSLAEMWLVVDVCGVAFIQSRNYAAVTCAHDEWGEKERRGALFWIVYTAWKKLIFPCLYLRMVLYCMSGMNIYIWREIQRERERENKNEDKQKKWLLNPSKYNPSLNFIASWMVTPRRTAAGIANGSNFLAFGHITYGIWPLFKIRRSSSVTCLSMPSFFPVHRPSLGLRSGSYPTTAFRWCSICVCCASRVCQAAFFCNGTYYPALCFPAYCSHYFFFPLLSFPSRWHPFPITSAHYISWLLPRTTPFFLQYTKLLWHGRVRMFHPFVSTSSATLSGSSRNMSVAFVSFFFLVSFPFCAHPLTTAVTNCVPQMFQLTALGFQEYAEWLCLVMVRILHRLFSTIHAAFPISSHNMSQTSAFFL